MVQLTEIPERIARLPRDHRGYPVPFFVDYVDGKPYFPSMDRKKWRLCLRDRLCWICGETLGAYLAFVAGPMCGINRTSAEPPSHLECAVFAVKNCPFLVNPNQRRIDPSTECQSGVMLPRNPGVSLVWVMKRFKVYPDGLLKIGDPFAITAWREGRGATAEEIHASIANGIPALVAMAEPANEMKQLRKAVDDFVRTLELFGYALPGISL